MARRFQSAALASSPIITSINGTPASGPRMLRRVGALESNMKHVYLGGMSGVGGILCCGLLSLVPASAAHAEFYFARAGGPLVITSDAPPLLQGRFEEFVFIQEGLFTFQSALVEFTITQQPEQPDLFAATTLFIDEAGDTLAGEIDGVRFVSAEGIWSGSGTWTVTGGTGQYAGVEGTGSFAFGVIPEEQTAFSTFEGTFIPASGTSLLPAAVLLAATSRRRRR